MRIFFRPALVTLLSGLFSFCIFSCKKSSTAVNPANDPCAKLAKLKIHPVAPVTNGGTVELTADSLTDVDYFWTGPNNYQSYSQSNAITAGYSDRGMYYLRASLSDCSQSRFDSVLVTVNFPQGTVSCSPANNTAAFGGSLILPDQNFDFIAPVTGVGDYEITGNSAAGDITFTLSAYWLTHEPEDGIYHTTSSPSIDYANIDNIFISDVNESIYWVAEPDKPVYISHVNGKLQITFCSINFSGSLGGPVYTTTVSAKITKP